MVGILIISHGSLPQALISSAHFVIGTLDRTEGIAFLAKESVQSLKTRIREKVAHLDEGDGVLILTDVLGGTPTNLSLSVLDPDKVDVVTGVNLPMVMALASHRDERSLAKLSKIAIKSGRKSITPAKKVLALRSERSARRAVPSPTDKILSVGHSARMSPKTITPLSKARHMWEEASAVPPPARKKI